MCTPTHFNISPYLNRQTEVKLWNPRDLVYKQCYASCSRKDAAEVEPVIVVKTVSAQY